MSDRPRQVPNPRRATSRRRRGRRPRGPRRAAAAPASISICGPLDAANRRLDPGRVPRPPQYPRQGLYRSRARGLVAERQREVEALVYEGVWRRIRPATAGGPIAVDPERWIGAGTATRHSSSSNGCSERDAGRRHHRSRPAEARGDRETPATLPCGAGFATAAVSAALALAYSRGRAPGCVVRGRAAAGRTAAVPRGTAAAPSGARVRTACSRRAARCARRPDGSKALRVLGRVDVADGSEGHRRASRRHPAERSWREWEAADAAREVTR
jgi:hypothetical protein